MITVLLREGAQAARRLSAAPAFLIVTVVSLALGMGVTSTAFSLLSAVLFRPLPFPDADRLVDVFEDNPVEVCEDCGVGTSWANYLEIRDQATSFDAMAAYRGQDFVWTGEVASERVAGGAVSGEFLSLLGGKVTLGRNLTDKDDRAGSPPVVVIGDRFWRERLGASPNVLGTTLRLEGVDYTVVGVLESGFAFTSAKDVWLPLGQLAASEGRDERNLDVVGRLAVDRNLSAASLELSEIGRRLESEYPEQAGWSTHVETLRSSLVEDYEAGFWAFLGAVTLVLLAAAANLAGLFLVRAADRMRETTVRAALGASRSALVRGLLAEGVVVALAGWAGGLLVALWGIDITLRLVGSDLAPWIQVTLDWRVVVFSGLTLASTTLLFGLLPAWKGSRPEVMSVLRAAGGPGGALGHGRLRRVMVSFEVAVAVVLVTGAGLFVRKVQEATRTDPGYDVTHLLVAEVETGAAGDANAGELLTRAIQAAASVEGVEAVSASNLYIIDFPGAPVGGIAAADIDDELAKVVLRRATLVTPGYFRAMGIPLVRGRDLTESDATGAPAVIVNEEVVKRLWPGQDALGKRIRVGGEDQPWAEVVAVAASVRTSPLATEISPQFYLPYSRYGGSNPPGVPPVLNIRTSGEPAGRVGAVKSALSAVGRDLVVLDVQTEADNLTTWIRPLTITMQLAAGLAAFTLFLSLMGIAGIVAHSLERKTKEFAVRAALGATGGGLTRTAVGEAMSSTAAGVVVGALLSIVLIRLLAGVMVGVAVIDPMVQAGAAALFAGAAGITGFAVARRVTRIHPADALRSE